MTSPTPREVSQSELDAIAPAAARRARAVWGSGPTSLKVRAASDHAAFAATLGEDAAGVPAATTEHGIVVDPAEFVRLTPRGRRVVLTHEALHVAMRTDPRVSQEGADVPLWLTEGLAEHTGWTAAGHHTGRATPAQAVPELLIARAAGTGPGPLPSDASFTGSATDRAVAYQASHVAVDALVRAHGLAAVIEVIRDTARGVDVETALRTETGAGLRHARELSRTALAGLQEVEPGQRASRPAAQR